MGLESCFKVLHQDLLGSKLCLGLKLTIPSCPANHKKGYHIDPPRKVKSMESVELGRPIARLALHFVPCPSAHNPIAFDPESAPWVDRTTKCPITPSYRMIGGLEPLEHLRSLRCCCCCPNCPRRQLAFLGEAAFGQVRRQSAKPASEMHKSHATAVAMLRCGNNQNPEPPKVGSLE